MKPLKTKLLHKVLPPEVGMIYYNTHSQHVAIVDHVIGDFVLLSGYGRMHKGVLYPKIRSTTIWREFDPVYGLEGYFPVNLAKLC